MQPNLETSRLLLRPFSPEDANRVRGLAGEYEVARYTEAVPHPYGEGEAERWIASHANELNRGTGITYAITIKESRDLIGAIGLVIVTKHKKANLGYWIGQPYWGIGYCSEAAKRLIAYAFDVLAMHRVIARHMECNPASGRVMQKIGMTLEGKLKDGVQRDGAFTTTLIYGITNGGLDAGRNAGEPAS